MSRTSKTVLIVVTTLLIAACNLFTQSRPNAQSPAAAVPAATTQAPPLAAVIPSSTASPLPQPTGAAATPTLTPAPSDTALPVFTATAKPKPIPSDTAAPALTSTATPPLPAAGTPASSLPSENPTTLALLGPLADIGDITQYYQPVGTPVESWHGIPIMPQATAGQEFKADVYSYKATASLAQASQYYTAKAASIGLPLFPPATGYGGRGSLASHNTTFFSPKLLIDLISLDNDPQHVIVVINKAP